MTKHSTNQPVDKPGGPDGTGKSPHGLKAPLATSLKAPLAPGGALDTLGRASLMGLHLVSGMIVGALLGYALDRWLNTFPWCSGIGFLFGIGAGFRNMWIDAAYLIRQGERPRRAQNTNQKTDPNHADQRDPGSDHTRP